MTACLARPEIERTEEAITEMAESYGHVLYGEVPYERLGDTYRQAMLDHKSNFSLTVVEFLTAWNKIRAKEASSKSKATPCLFCSTYEANPNEVRKCPFHG